ncbi:MAG: phosphotransferase, partial [Gallionella sp.]
CIVSRLTGRSAISPNLQQCTAIGAMLGQMHIAGQSFAQVMPNPRGSHWRNMAAPQVRPFLDSEQASLLNSEVVLHADRDLSGLPQGLIHADLFHDNVLLDGDRVGGLIDFYFACTDALLYDVAITINDWCMGNDHKLDVGRAKAFLGAYHAVRPLQKAERLAWPLMLRLAALRFWLSRLYDLHLPRDGELVNPRNPEHFKQVLQNHIGTTQPVWL